MKQRAAGPMQDMSAAAGFIQMVEGRRSTAIKRWVKHRA
jgi:hypothetical protein